MWYWGALLALGLRETLATTTAAGETSTTPAGTAKLELPFGFDAWSSRLSWNVVNVVAPTYYATNPPMASCSEGVIPALAKALGLPVESLSAILSILGLSALEQPIDPDVILSNSWVPDPIVIRPADILRRLEAVNETRNVDQISSNTELMKKGFESLQKPYEQLERSFQDAMFAFHKMLETAAGKELGRSFLALPSGRAPSLDLFLDVPDLLTGFLSSRMVTHVIAPALGDFAGRYGDSRSYVMNGMSPFQNLGQAICRAIDISTKNDFDPLWVQCAFATVVANLMSCGPDEINCSAMDTLPDPFECDTTITGVDLTLTVPDLQITPESEALDADGNVKQSVIDAEGFTYYLLMTSNFAASTWAAPEAYCLDQPRVPELVPGWTRELEIWMNQEASPMQEIAKRPAVPFVILSRKNETQLTCDLLLTQRGTRTGYEWMVNFEAQQVAPSWTSNPEVLVHRGYADLVSAAGPALLEYLRDRIFPVCAPEYISLTITGHSLGGGVSEVWALFLSEQVPNLRQLNLVTFAASHALNQAGQDQLGANGVNVRSIVNELDLIPYFPCESAGLPRCSASNAGALFGVGRDDAFGKHRNTIIMDAEELGALSGGRFNQKQVTSLVGKGLSLQGYVLGPDATTPAAGPVQIGINHVCGYACYWGSKYCLAPPANPGEISKYCEACNPMLPLFLNISLV